MSTLGSKLILQNLRLATIAKRQLANRLRESGAMGIVQLTVRKVPLKPHQPSSLPSGCLAEQLDLGLGSRKSRCCPAPKNHAAFSDVVIWKEGSTAAVPPAYAPRCPSGGLCEKLPVITCVLAPKCVTYWVARTGKAVGMDM